MKVCILTVPLAYTGPVGWRALKWRRAAVSWVESSPCCLTGHNNKCAMCFWTIRTKRDSAGWAAGRRCHCQWQGSDSLDKKKKNHEWDHYRLAINISQSMKSVVVQVGGMQSDGSVLLAGIISFSVAIIPDYPLLPLYPICRTHWLIVRVTQQRWSNNWEHTPQCMIAFSN